jgi:hypothetical protein
MLLPIDYSLKVSASISALKISPTMNKSLKIYIEVEAAYNFVKHLKVAGTSFIIYLA